MGSWPVLPLLASIRLLASGGDVAGPRFAFIVLPLAQAVICWRLVEAFQHIPQRYRFQEPGRVWLLMVPLFNIFWNFKVLPPLAESFQLYYYSRGIADVEDCGERLARWYCWLGVTWLIPCLNFLTGLASLVVVILFLIEADKLTKRIMATAKSAARP
jgi:hypothetical protein